MYFEPKSSFENLVFYKEEGRYILLRDLHNQILEIRFFVNIGWSFEVRYDLKNLLQRRQIFTGEQPRLDLEKIDVEENQEKIILKAGDQVCSFEKKTGAFIIEKNGELIFQSQGTAFTSHEKPVEVFEGLMSLKITDFTDRAPFAPKGETFSSHMLRFQYARPEGLVLGLAGQSGEMNRNGYRFELYNTDEFHHIPSRKPLYQSWPILFHQTPNGKSWMGVFHDNPSRTFVDLGDFYNDKITFESLTGNSRVHLIFGEDLAEVSQKMSRLLGRASMPPLWAFGYQQCRWSYMTSMEVRDVVRKFQEEQIPLDAVYFDIDYMDGFRVFTVNQNTFGDMAGCIEELHQKGVKSICIVDPGVKIDPEYQVYKDLHFLGAYLKNEDGSDFVAKIWPGKALLPDFGDENMRDWWADVQKKWLSTYHFDGVWNDMNEPSNFDGANAATAKAFNARGAIRNEYNLYGYYMAQASALGCEKSSPGKRPLVITRSGYPGSQKSAIVWHGDNQAWWEHLRFALDTSIQYSLSGAYYNGPDVPGFTGNPSDDLAVRFFQLGAFLPLFRGHSIYFAKDKEPYAYGPRAKVLIKKAIELRYSLLREWYSGFDFALRHDQSPLMPVLDKQGILVRDHLLLFDKFLVAPILDRDQTRKLVYLPEGDWYEFENTSKRIPGGGWIMLEVSDESVPVFVKAGSIVVRNTVGKNTMETLAQEEHFEVYPDAAGNAQGDWFQDDGQSFHDQSALRKRIVYNPQSKLIEEVEIENSKGSQ